jgi:hypothetical protein
MSKKTIPLSSVEQALVSEVTAWAVRIQRETEAAVNAKLACILEAHGLTDKVVNFSFNDNKWSLILEEKDATQEGLVSQDNLG